MAGLTTTVPIPSVSTSDPHARRTLIVAGFAHALHDGYTDLIYVLLPVWQAEFALGYGVLAFVRGIYTGAMAGLQIPVGRLAERLGGRMLLALGTALAALGYALAGFSGGLLGLCFALALSGAGSSTQHPIASAAVSRAYGGTARGPLGIYNFTGDLGKAALPAATSVLLTILPWRSSLCRNSHHPIVRNVPLRFSIPGPSAQGRLHQCCSACWVMRQEQRGRLWPPP
jgi:MFS transporter, FSR family, fosmidomycin resistance protein